jgi:predicted AlkP superfamily phosphohydrolase/phosphomutase
MASPTRILFVGVDAGDKDLITQWAGEGALPTFRDLMARGAWGVTENPVGLFVGAVWPSFYTGASPARHGRYCYSQIKPGTYENPAVLPTHVRAEPFWAPLSRAGRKVAIVDVPKTFPCEEVNGIHLVDWGTHDRDYDFCARPHGMKEEVEARFGAHPLGKCDGDRTTAAEFGALRDGLVAGVRRKAEIASHYLDRGGWDLFATVFGESHCAGHQCWHVHDPAHPRHDAGVARDVGDPLEDVYRAIDSAVGSLLARVGPDTAVFVLASHGMGPHYDGTFLLDEILDALEKADLPPQRKRAAGVLEWGWRAMPPGLRRLARPLRGSAKKALGAATTDPGIESRRFFQVPNNDVYGAIRVNLAGREPKGLVRPGAEFDALCEALSRDLLAFVNMNTGKPLVKRVLRTKDLYPGGGDDLPDLLVEWDREKPITTISSPKVGTIDKAFPGTRTGDHKPNGLFFALGPAVEPGRIDREVSVMDFAPTFASLLGVTLPNVDGEPVAELIGVAGLKQGV